MGKSHPPFRSTTPGLGSAQVESRRRSKDGRWRRGQTRRWTGEGGSETSAGGGLGGGAESPTAREATLTRRLPRAG